MRELRSWVGLVVLLFGAQPAAAISLSPFVDAMQVVTGLKHSCALTLDGTVWCWGGNDIGQLGVGETSPFTARTTPVQVPDLGGVLGLASSDSHTCAITADRGVTCWGLNDTGQSGDATLSYALSRPQAVSGVGNSVIAVTAGSQHSCALLEGGEVRCWGDDQYGQLGDGSAGAPRANAAPVTGLGGAAVSIEAGGNHTCASLANGSVRCWGRNNSGQLGDGSTTDRATPVPVQGLPGAVRALAAGVDSSCAVTQTGALYCWGPQYPLLAFDGGSLVARAYPGLQSDVVLVTGGDYHFCTVTSTAFTRCFGENAYGQFGTGIIGGEELLPAINLSPVVVQISAGAAHTCARNSEGRLQCWGDNRFGQLGIDATSQRLVPGFVAGLFSEMKDVGIGNYHGCALTNAGAVKCWGDNGAQQVGDGSTELRLTPHDVIGLSSGVRAIAVGSDSSCAINEGRRALCWGANYSGQLGIGGPPETAPPTAVVGLGNVDVSAIDVGRQHACALLAGGVVKCWGDNSFGQLGNGTRSQSDVPVDVSGLGSGVKAIATGYLHTCAITASDGMKCWGLNENGQLGDGTTTDRLTPVDVVGLSSGVTAIGPGGLHTCAIVTGGRVKCWGANYFGLLLGDGSLTDRAVPGDVPSLTSGAVDLAVQLFGTCVRMNTGAMRCWGSNDGGAVGDNSTISRPTPVDVSGLNRGVTAMDAGYGLGGHTCAIADGAALCWGENTFAQLGDGSTHGVAVAQNVLSNPAARRVAALAEANDAIPNPVQLDGSGRYVLVTSDADDLVPGDSNGATDVFLFDRQEGVATRVSVDDGEGEITGASTAASMSADARLVVFVAPDAGVARLRGESTAKALARRKGGGSSVYLRNLLTGTTQQIAPASSTNAYPQISAAGTSIVFTAPVTDDAIGTLGQNNVFLVSLAANGSEVVPAQPVCVSCKPTSTTGAPGLAKADGASGEAVVSADGQWIAYATQANNGVADQATPCPAAGSEVILRNMLTGTTQRIAPPPGTPTGQCASLGSSAPSIDAGGTLLAWQTDQPLDGSDGNGLNDVYACMIGDGTLFRASQGLYGVDGNGASTQPAVSGDGRQVVFVSGASNLDTRSADNNDRVDVHTFAPGIEPVRLSLSPTGAEANAASAAPVLNFDGSQVAFISAASLLTGQVGGPTAVLTRDNPQAPGKRSSTWWRASESGWGLTVFDQGSVLTPTWFTYDSDGEPSWFLVAGAFRQTDGTYTGEVYRFTGTPLLQIDGQAAQTVTLAGTATLSYVGEDLLHFNYTVDGFSQRKTLRKFPFGTRSFSCTTSPTASRAAATNYTDLWSGAAIDAGWGLTLFHVDDLLVAIWYTYDTDGEAVFFVITTNRQPDGSYSGDIFRQRNGVPFSDIDDALSSPGSDVVGTARFDFTSGELANFSYTLGGVSQTRGIRRLVVGDAPHVCRSADLAGD